jgi:hypothetical protein
LRLLFSGIFREFRRSRATPRTSCAQELRAIAQQRCYVFPREARLP